MIKVWIINSDDTRDEILLNGFPDFVLTRITDWQSGYLIVVTVIYSYRDMPVVGHCRRMKDPEMIVILVSGLQIHLFYIRRKQWVNRNKVESSTFVYEKMALIRNLTYTFAVPQAMLYFCKIFHDTD